MVHQHLMIRPPARRAYASESFRLVESTAQRDASNKFIQLNRVPFGKFNRDEKKLAGGF